MDGVTRDSVILEFADRLPALFRAHVEPTAVRKITLSQTALSQLQSSAETLPPIDMADVNMAQGMRHALAQLDIMGDDGALSRELREALEQYRTTGACIISFGEDFAGGQETEIKRALLTALSPFGLTFGAFHQRGLWQRLGVNKDAANLRAESVGEIPLHIDFDQARQPPDGVALFCVRPDPLGGGESTLFNYERFLDALDAEEADLMAQIEYSYATLYGANGIGDVYNPHPLVDMEDNQPRLLRYNGKAVADVEGDVKTLFKAMETQFSDYAAEVSLGAGDLVISNQNKTLHGRRPLAQRPEDMDVPVEEDRLLYQIYLRSDCEM